ncbi:FTR1 family iron permease [Clostridium psychrophilum]|uniref:FTR1 family iron permease n=1 Tax=Clostridium psychrophilum TaxID=132926 RepID=UPI001C0D1F65|nr:FTR1 family protein [Clostridium psychrophilum]MBU3181197.1 FTR1 family protein [Clostridium psychrophilum]
MFNVFIITLREGVEIAIVLAIIISYLKQLGQMKETGKIWLGTGAAALISLLIALGIFFILGTTEIEGFQAVLEGTLKIVAVIMLTWMTIWMKRQGGNIGGELKRQIQVAISRGSAWTLISLAFVSVLREGIETVLFIVGSAQETSAVATISGSILGFGVAAILGYILYRGTYHLPLNSFFTVMSILLIVMAAGLLSGGVHEFQEIHMIPVGIEQLWSTKAFLDQKSMIGGLLKAIFGYADSPNLVQVLAYWMYLLGALYAYFKPKNL